MPLIYSLIARGTTILAEYNIPSVSGNFALVTRRILEKIPANQNSKMSYMYDRHIFHYMVDDGLVYMTMADEAFGRRLPFAFLEDIKNRFKAAYGDRGKTAPEGAMKEDFSRVLQTQMDYFSNNPNADMMRKVKGDIDQLTNVLVQNIEKVLERGEHIELLVDRTEALNNTSIQFKQSATGLKRALWWKNVKLILIIIALVALLAFIITLFACGGFTFSRCRSHSKSTPKTVTPTTPTPTTAAPTTAAPTTAAPKKRFPIGLGLDLLKPRIERS